MNPTRILLLAAAAFYGVAATPIALAHGDAVGSETVTSRTTGIHFEHIATLDHPWGVEVMPDGALLVTEKPGRLRVWRDGALSAPIRGVPRVAFRDQGGLLDVALDPNFASNRVIYLSFSEAADHQPGGADVADPRLGAFQDLTDATVKGLAVARAVLNRGRLVGLRVIWRSEKTVGRGHFAGRMAFLPDGSLLIASGDRQRFEPAQHLESDLGKILRINPITGAALADNPFFSRETSARDVWSYGHRNPLGIAVRPGTDEVWVAEMGPQNGDELNLIQSGGNFGWPLVSPGDNYNATPLPRPVSEPSYVRALTEFPLAISPSSLMFYDGDMFSAWRGNILVGALNRPGIVRGVPAPDGLHDLEHIETGFRVRDIAQAADGAIYVLRDGPEGGLLRMTPLLEAPRRH